MIPNPATHTFRIETTRQGESQIVALHGSLSTEAHVEAKDALLDLLNGNPSRIVVDLTDLTYISSSGIGLLVALLRRCRQRGISLPVCGLRPDLLEIFKATRLNQVFEMFPDRPAALKVLPPRPKP